MSNKPTTDTPVLDLNAALKGKELYAFWGLASLLVFLLFRDYLLGSSTYLFRDIGSDTVNFNYPFLYYITKQIHETGVPTWTFTQGMGQSAYPWVFGDAFNWIYYLWGPENMPTKIVYVEIFKLLLAGTLFVQFLKYMNINPVAVVIGALLYTFSGYGLIGGTWYVFSSNLTYLVLLLWGFERLYRQNSYWMLILGVAMLASYQVVMLYVNALFLGLFFIMRYFGDKGLSDLKGLGILVAKAFVAGVIGVGFAVVNITPFFLDMYDSPRFGGESGYINKLSSVSIFFTETSNYYGSLVLRTISNNLLGSGTDYKGWYNYLEAPMNYGGILALILAPVLLFMLEGRKRLLYASTLGIMVFVQVFPWFRYAFWMFLGDYFRNLSLFSSCLFQLMTIWALDELFKTNKKPLVPVLASGLVWLILLYYPWVFDNGSDVVDAAHQSFCAFMIVVYVGLLIGLFYMTSLRKTLQITLLVMVFAELFIISKDVLNGRPTVTKEELTSKIGYNDYTVDAVKYLKAKDKDFYRLTKNYASGTAIHGSMNDAKVQDYFGTMSYYSFNHPNYIRYLAKLKVLDPKNESETRWVSGVSGELLLHPTTASKYFLFKGETYKNDPMFSNLFTRDTTFGDVNILKNKHTLPLGFVYHKLISNADFNKLDKVKRSIATLNAALIDSLEEVKLKNSLPFIAGDSIPAPNAYSFQVLANDASKLRKDTLVIDHFEEAHIKGHLNVSQKGIFYLSIPIDRGWSLKIDGKETPFIPVFGGLMGAQVETGQHQIDLEYTQPYLKQAVLVSLFFGLIFLGVIAFELISKRKKTKEMQ
jgi:uncharacterized membrane protein YfhO